MLYPAFLCAVMSLSHNRLRVWDSTAKMRIVRKSGPQNLRGAEASELRLFRNLQNQVLT